MSDQLRDAFDSRLSQGFERATPDAAGVGRAAFSARRRMCSREKENLRGIFLSSVGACELAIPPDRGLVPFRRWGPGKWSAGRGWCPAHLAFDCRAVDACKV